MLLDLDGNASSRRSQRRSASGSTTQWRVCICWTDEGPEAVEITDHQARDLLEIIDDRHGRGSTIVTSQLAVEHWHELIPNPTIADAILDRLVHNAHRLILTGESIRKTEAKRAGLDAKK